MNVWLADGNANTTFSNPAPNLITLSTRDDDSNKTEITINSKTFLPEREAVVFVSHKSHSVVTRTRKFEEWGESFPRRTINFRGDRKVADIRLKELRLDRGMKTDDLAVKPEGLQPEMSHCRR